MVTFEPGPFADPELQDAANFLALRKTLRPAGLGCIVFGVIAVVMGLGGLEENSSNGILVLIGGFLVIVGIGAITAPNREGILRDGLALLTVGAWNTIGVFSTGRGGGIAHFGLLGVFQLFWGAERIARYRRFPETPLVAPTPELRARFDALLQSVLGPKMAEDGALIEFRVNAGLGMSPWRGRLFADWAMFVERSGQEILFARREEVAPASLGKLVVGKTLEVSISIRERELHGTMPPESYRRLEEWKARG